MGDESKESDSISNIKKKGYVCSQQIHEASRKCIDDIFSEVLHNQFLPQFEKISLESSLNDKIESIMNLRNSLCRFDILRCELGLTDCTTSFKGKEDIGFLSRLYSIIDMCLSILNNSCKIETSKNHHCSLLIDLAIKVAMKDIFFNCKSAVNYDVKESGSLYDGIASNTERLIDICEAIITSDESDNMDIKFGLKFACLNNLMALLLFFNSNISHKCVKQRFLSEMVQSQVCQIIERAVFMFGVMEIRETSFYKVLVEKGLAQVEMKLQCQKEIITSLVHLVQLVNHSLMDIKFCSVYLAFFGFSSSVSNPILPYLFGKSWNELTENLLKASMYKKFSTIDTNRIFYYEGWCESISEFIFKGLNTSISFYCSGMIMNLDTIQEQVKLIISQFKFWAKLAVNEKYRKLLHLNASISKEFSNTCKNVILYMKAFETQNLESSRRWSMISELSSANDFKNKRIISCDRTSFDEVTAIWKIMGAIGGAMQRIFISLNMELFEFEELYFLIIYR